MSDDATIARLHPLEEFFQDYIDTTGGAMQRIEPQVYDVLPPADARFESTRQPADLVRVCFDPEALPEHPGSQFLTLGTPLLDQVLADAQARGRYARAFLLGLNNRPFDLSARLCHTLRLPPKAQVRVAEQRLVHVTTSVFWFAATYLADQKEQELFQLAIERHHGREVRHLETLLAPHRLSEHPTSTATEDADQITLVEACRRAREQVVRTVAATANRRRRELAERHQRQRERMSRYYRDLLDEIDHAAARGAADADQRRAARRRAVEQERELRLAELARKYALRVQLTLTNLLEVAGPKLQLDVRLSLPSQPQARLQLIWDPLTEAFEPPVCPACQRPSFAFQPVPRTHAAWHCPNCAR